MAHLHGRFVPPEMKGEVLKRNKLKTHHGGGPVPQSHSQGISLLVGVLFTWSLMRIHTPSVFAPNITNPQCLQDDSITPVGVIAPAINCRV